jgi:hypothetical protein
MEINHVANMGSVKPVKICHKPIVTNMTDKKYHGYLERGHLVSSNSGAFAHCRLERYESFSERVSPEFSLVQLWSLNDTAPS